MKHALPWAAALAIAAAPLDAQPGSLASRIAAVREGTVRMSFPARPGVCGDGRGSVWIQDRDKGWNDRQYVCVAGPVMVRLGRADNQTVSVRKWVGGSWALSSSEVDLGDVSAAEAARYLLTLSHTLGGSNADEAMAAAAFADAPGLGPGFRAIVVDDNAPISSRRQALFWFGQSDAPTRELTDLYDALRVSSLREQYPFVLSQRHDDAALDKLIDVARNDRDFDIRKQALFWLGQSKDPRAAKFIRDMIVR